MKKNIKKGFAKPKGPTKYADDSKKQNYKKKQKKI